MVRRVAVIVLFLSLYGTSAWAGPKPVTLAWDPNPETTVIGYRIYVGTSHMVYSAVYDVGKVTTYTFAAGEVGKTYYFAVTAYVTGPLEGPKSGEVSTVIVDDGTTGGTPLPPPPPPPPPPPDDGTDPEPQGVILAAPVVKGSTVSLSWKPIDTVKIVEYALEVGSAPGQSDLYNASVGTATRLSGSVGEGTYYVRVRGRTSLNANVTSNEISFSIGGGTVQCTAPPARPSRPSGTITQGVATVTWRAVAGATSYVLQAGTASGLSDVFNGNVGEFTAVTATVPAGFTAYLRVIAVNACGQSPASAEIHLR